MQRKTDLERFEEKYIPEPNSGCWLWTAACGQPRSGGPRTQFQINGRVNVAARAAWILYRGSEPGPVDVCHKCDVSLCVNPDHLFLGTRSDSNNDCVAKERWGGPNILTYENVRAIRSSKDRAVDLAARFGVGPNQISRIRTGKRWAWLSQSAEGAV